MPKVRLLVQRDAASGSGTTQRKAGTHADPFVTLLLADDVFFAAQVLNSVGSRT